MFWLEAHQAYCIETEDRIQVLAEILPILFHSFLQPQSIECCGCLCNQLTYFLTPNLLGIAQVLRCGSVFIHMPSIFFVGFEGLPGAPGEPGRVIDGMKGAKGDDGMPGLDGLPGD